MLKVRLFRISSSDYYKLLDESSLPNIDSLEDLGSVVAVIGKMLTKYVDSLKDPNLVTIANDPTQEWTVMDYLCLKSALQDDRYMVMVTDEETEVERPTDKEIVYMMIDSSERTLGVFPKSSQVKYDIANAIRENKIVDAIMSLLSPYTLFSQNKFLVNPIEQSEERLTQSKSLLGTTNESELRKLITQMSRLELKLFAYTNDTI